MSCQALFDFESQTREAACSVTVTKAQLLKSFEG